MGSVGELKINVLITGAAGFIGQALASALMQDRNVEKITLTDISKPEVPSASGSSCRVEAFAADLTDKATCEETFTPDVTHAYLLHGIMSGAAEANLELGLRVNVDSMRYIMDALKSNGSTVPCRVIFPSSLAVFGPSEDGDVVTEATMPLPRSSYGAEKAIVEILLNDFSRRGLIDGRIVRLPTIVVRPGKPTGAASSFCSGIIREPLNGQKSVLPVSRDLKLWVCSTRTIIKNLLIAKDIPEKAFGAGSRVVNLPGRTVTVQEMLQALKAVGGDAASKLVHEEYDERVANIVGSWPAEFDTSRAKQLGFQQDVDMSQTLRDYIEDYKQ